MQKLIIWDWNGTLLNDVEQSIITMNTMLDKRNMKYINKEIYRNIFTFPVYKYYEKLGFNFEKESFTILSKEYINIYKKEVKYAKLFKNVINVLNHFKNKEYKQIILSAMEQNMLDEQLHKYEINEYFDDIIGLKDIYANSKADTCLDYLKQNNQYSNVYLIGDTYHDYEVATKANIKCMLINNGHQDLLGLKDNISNLDKIVYKNIEDVVGIL